MWNLPQHSYEEIREIVVDIVIGEEKLTYQADQFLNLVNGVAEVFGRRQPVPGRQGYVPRDSRLHPNDAELVRDVFWDLFRQGFITLGLNDSNPNWPFFRMSHFGKQALQNHKPFRFHDTASFIAIAMREVPDISPEAAAYLDEAVSAFYAGCLFASCVMLGVAAEAEFLRLVEVAVSSPRYGQDFAGVSREHFVRAKITKFWSALKPQLPKLTPRAFRV
jgi:hypothetical protein